MYEYTIHGLSLLSQVRIGSLPPGPCPTWGDPVRFHYTNPSGDLAREITRESGGVECSSTGGWSCERVANGSAYRIRFSDGTLIRVDASGLQIWAVGAEGATVEDTLTYVLGPVFAFVLRLRGHSCLHASAAVIGEQAVLFVGPSGSGKSTLAAAFALRGARVLSDDAVALRCEAGFVHAIPASTRVRLWPDSVAGLFGSEDALPRITPNWDKRDFASDSPGTPAAIRSVPVGAVYLLEQRSDAHRAPVIVDLDPVSALLRLLENTHGNYSVTDSMHSADFDCFADLVSLVPCRSLRLPQGFGQLARACDAVVRDAGAAATRRAQVSAVA